MTNPIPIDADALQAEKSVEKIVETPNPKKYFLEKKFVPKWLGDVILQQHRFLCFVDDGTLWFFNGREYEPGEPKIAEIVKNELNYEFSTKRLHETQAYVAICAHAKREEKKLPQNLIPVKNGLLEWQTRQLLSFTPDYFFTSVLPVDYRPECGCPEIEKFIEIVCPGNLPLIRELMGNTLLRSAKFETATILYGQGGNGKSTFLSLIEKLHGNENKANLSLQQICDNDDKFILAQLYEKTVNVCDDLPKQSVDFTGQLKSAVSGKAIMGQHKGKPHFSFNPFAKFFFAANEFPRTKDTTPAYWRRWIILDFPIKFVDGDNADKNLDEKLGGNAEEMSGFLNFALEGLKKIEAQGFISRSENSEETRLTWLSQSDPLAVFFEKFVKISESSSIEKNKLFSAFVEFCEEEDAKPCGDSYFFKVFRNRFPNCLESRKKQGVKRLPAVLKGVCLLWGVEEQEKEDCFNNLSSFDEKVGGQGEQGQTFTIPLFLLPCEKPSSIRGLPLSPLSPKPVFDAKKLYFLTIQIIQEIEDEVGGENKQNLTLDKINGWNEAVALGLDKQIEAMGIFTVDAQNCVQITPYGRKFYCELKNEYGVKN